MNIRKIDKSPTGMSENTIIDIVNESNNINVSELGVTFSENATIEEWERFGEQIGRVVNSSQFIIGDWLNFGRDKWQNREELQERIEIAEKNTGLDARSLQNYASIARRIPMGNRSANCSFDIHRSVAKLDSDDQRKWLKVADERNMTTRVLKASIKAGKPITKEEQKSAQPESVHTYDDCVVFVHNIFRWYTRKKNAGYFDKLSVEQLVFQRDKLKSVAEIYNEFNSMIREKQKGEN